MDSISGQGTKILYAIAVSAAQKPKKKKKKKNSPRRSPILLRAILIINLYLLAKRNNKMEIKSSMEKNSLP